MLVVTKITNHELVIHQSILLNFTKRFFNPIISHDDICRPTYPPCGLFRYFMVLIDAPTSWSHVCLLLTRNQKINSWKRISVEIELSLSHLNPHTKEYGLKVQKVIHLRSLVNQSPNAFLDPKRVTKSHIPVANAPIRIDVPVGQSNIANESQARMKHGRLIDSKYKNTRVRKGVKRQNDQNEDIETAKDFLDIINIIILKETQGLIFEETYSPVVDASTFRYLISFVSYEGLNLRLMDIDIAYLYDSLDNDIYMILLEGFNMPNNLGSREGYLIKLNKSFYGLKQLVHMWYNHLSEYLLKEVLVAQGFSQRPGMDFEETYSPVMDARLNLHLMNVVIIYLYGSLDNDIYIKLREGFNMLNSLGSREGYLIKLNKSLYGIKQLRHMLYNQLGGEYLLKEGYVPICSPICMRRSGNEFTIIVVYVDSINIIRTPKELLKAIGCLKKEFEMKVLGKTKFCLGL
ncbi:hypothetical protein CR513_43037, partial [Mucuna pruriens]